MYWCVIVCWVSGLARPSRALLLGLLFLQSMLAELDDWWLCHSHGMARRISMSVSDPQGHSFHEASLSSYTRVVSGAAVLGPLWSHSRGPSGSGKVPGLASKACSVAFSTFL